MCSYTKFSWAEDTGVANLHPSLGYLPSQEKHRSPHYHSKKFFTNKRPQGEPVGLLVAQTVGLPAVQRDHGSILGQEDGKA